MNVTEKEIVRQLKTLCILKGSQRKAAKAMGISQNFLREVMLGHRGVTAPSILRYLKLKKIVTIRRKYNDERV